MNNFQKSVRRKVEDGYVLDWSGEWVALERAIARDVEARAHLAIGEVYLHGRWVPLDQVKSDEELEPPPQPVPSAGKTEYDSDPLADEDTVTLRVVADEQSTRTLEAADEPVPPESPSKDGNEEDTTCIYTEEQEDASDIAFSPSPESQNDTRPISVPGHPDTVLVEVVLNENADSSDNQNAEIEEAGSADPVSGLNDIFGNEGTSEDNEKTVSPVRHKKQYTEPEDDVDEWEQSKTGWKMAIVVAGASAVAVGGITYALLRFVF